ncbi:MAG: choice-of-anchor I family protein [Eubacteriales bacterium]|nr:choice-of-anchor I family protein [Eubacteriales bacterium]
MRKSFIKKALVTALLASMVTTTIPMTTFRAQVFAEETVNAEDAANTVGVSKGGTYKPDSLTLQPGETTSSINLNWYAPEGTTSAIVDFGGKQYTATPGELTTPTVVNTDKYTDTGKKTCKLTISDLQPETAYVYQISNDGGATWSKSYIYTTPASDEFTFGFTSDPQIKASGESNSNGWNPSDGTNQTGWAKMVEKLSEENVSLIVSAGDQVEDQSWGKSSEYEAFFAPDEMGSIAYAPAVGNHDRHYMFEDHFNLPNEMTISGETAQLTPVFTTFRGQNSGTSQSHGNYIQATESEISNNSNSNGVTPNADGQYDFTERREMETKGNYYYLYNNVLFVTLNTGAYPGGNDSLEGENVDNISSKKDNSEAEAIVKNFKTTLTAATTEYSGKYNWIVVTHHKSTQTVAKHVADSDIENYVDAGFEKLMDEFDVDFVLGGHDHVYSRSYVLKDDKRNSENLDTFNDVDGTIYITGNCCSDMQYYTPFEKVDKANNADYPILADGSTGSENYMKGKLPIGNLTYNQEFSPSYAIFNVTADTISVNVYNLSGDSEKPDSKEIDSFTVTKNVNTGAKTEAYDNATAALQMTETARFNSGMTNADGGVMEIVDYNTATGWAYAINGQSGNLTAITIKDIEESTDIDLLDGKNIDIKSIIEKEVSGFKYGDMTSVAVSPDNKTIAVAIQAENYAANGRVAVFECNTDGTLTFTKSVEVGVQPDMVTYTPNDAMILTANEGEPRLGYTDGTVDPAGSVSIIKTSDLSVNTIDFEAFDEKRTELVNAGIVIKKDTNPSVDLEPEYIAATDTKAYITLQEANAVAVLDLTKAEYSGIYSAGFEDYSTTAIDIDKKDEKYVAKTYASLMGIRMPDSITAYTVDGQDYIVTANEGDSRDWDGYLNELEVNFGKGKASPTGAITAENSGLTGKVVFFDSSDYEGLSSEKDYLFGGRSFTVYKVTDNGIEEVYTSANELETKTAALIPDNFNCSNDDKTIDDRSGKKGVEAESVTLGTVGEKTYAFVGLERIGGIMVYDISDPANVSYVNYINSRDFSEDIAGDVSPEGLCFVSASESKTGKPMLLAACEVSGTVAVYDITEVTKEDDKPSVNPDDKPEEIPDEQENASSETVTDKVDTDDSAPVAMMILIALLSAGALAVSVNGKLKKKED